MTQSARKKALAIKVIDKVDNHVEQLGVKNCYTKKSIKSYGYEMLN